MNLTRRQRKHLEALMSQRRNGVSLAATLLKAKLFLALHVVVILAGVFYLYQGGGWQLAGCVIIGFSAGSCVRFCRTVIAASQLWSTSTEIIDWPKVEALLKKNEY